MAVERFRVRAPGADLACVRFGSGPPLVCVHALAFSKEYFVSAAPILGARFTCVAFDQRGHGETEWQGGDAGIDVNAMADDVGAVMDHVGWAKAAVGGISLGAATTLVYALRHPERLDRLIQDLPAFSPRSPRDPVHSEAVASALDRADLDAALGVLTEGLSSVRAKPLAAALRAHWTPFGTAIGPKLAAAFRGTDRWEIVENWPEPLRHLQIPVDVLGLAGDSSHPIHVARQMVAALPNARFHSRVPSLSAEAVARQWAALT